MSGGAPWSVKGIDPKAREVAKDLARRSGMTLGAWLNSVILEDDVPEEVTAEAQIAARPRPTLLRPLAAEPQDLARVARTLESLTERLEASETRTGLAISSVEHTVREMLARMDTGERAQFAIGKRLDGALHEQAAFLGRLETLETQGPRAPEALRLLESRIATIEARDPADLLQGLGSRVADAEERTGSALRELADSLAVMDSRLASVERARGAASEARFEALADELGRRVDALREEMAEKLQASVRGDVEARLAEMAGHVDAAERRASQAVERIGVEVVRMAEAVSRRLSATEERSAEAIDLVGAEIARIAGAVEARLARAETVQAEALERLGSDVGRVTELFAERIEGSERRAAEAVEGVGAQLARLSEQLGLAEPQAAPSAQSAPETPEPLPAAQIAPELPESASAARDATIDDAAAHGEPGWPVGAFGPDPIEAASPGRAAALLAEAPRVSLDAFDDQESFAPIPESDDDLFAAQVLEEDAEPDAEPTSSLSTREVIEQARAAARANEAAIPTEFSVRAERLRPSPSLFYGFGAFEGVGPKPASPSKRNQSALNTALMVAGGAAFLSVGAAGVVLMQSPQGRPTPLVAEAVQTAEPRAAVALATGPAAPIVPVAAGGAGEMAFNDAVKAVESHQAGGLGRLKTLAEGGYAPAQFYLAQLYESGDAGVIRNMAEARRWTALAAEGGVRKAMHNLGVYYFRGEGGPQDLASAAQWFRKAAELGQVESQYNLGLMYQSGSGVKKDPAEALNWFGQAADQGDDQAKAAVEALKAQAFAPPAKPALSLPAVQQILSRLGYYDGAADGQPNARFRAALAEYQRDQGQPATGQLDAKTSALLSVFQR